MILLDIQEKKETPPENIIFGRPSLQDLMLLSPVIHGDRVFARKSEPFF
jgi:hypothetical protein